MSWYSFRQLAKELGIAPNTFKKYYLEIFPPDRESKNIKVGPLNQWQRLNLKLKALNKRLYSNSILKFT